MKTDESPTKALDIPENIQQICREFADVARKHGLYKFNGSFSLPSEYGWGGDISFGWSWGRHGDESNQIKIASTFNVFTSITPKKV